MTVPTWPGSPTAISALTSGLVRPWKVTALSKIPLVSSRMKAASPVPGDEFGGNS